MERRTKLQRFLLRWKIARRILFKEKHFVVIYLTGEDLTDLIESKPLKGVDISYAGMMEHQCNELIQQVGTWINPTEIICAKATFEVYCQEQINNTNGTE